MSRIEVVYTASRNLYPYLMASVRSLLDYNPDARVWMLIEDDRLPYDVPWNVEVVNVSAQTLFDARCVNWNTPFTYMSLLRCAYSKLFTGEPNGYGVRTLPGLDRILQLDVDTIVQDDLTPVWEVEVSGRWFAAVPDNPANYRPWGSAKYYNVGVSLFNLEQIRLDGADDLAIEMVNTKRMQFIDEMAWNRLNNERGNRMSVDLDCRWNQNTEVDQTLDVGVMHYAGVKYWWRDFDRIYRPWYIIEYSRYFELGGLSSDNRAQNVELKKLSSINWILHVDRNMKVKYLAVNDDGTRVIVDQPFYDALRGLLKGEMRVSNRHGGFPLTVDGVHFYAGEARIMDRTEDQDGKRYDVQLGADGLPILAYAE